jgi:hypothetical protein
MVKAIWSFCLAPAEVVSRLIRGDEHAGKFEDASISLDSVIDWSGKLTGQFSSS